MNFIPQGFRKLSYYSFTDITYRQTDRQTDGCHQKHITRPFHGC